MSARHAPGPEVIYRRGHVGSAEFFTSLCGHGDDSMMGLRFGCNGKRDGPDFVLVHGIGVSVRTADFLAVGKHQLAAPLLPHAIGVQG